MPEEKIKMDLYIARRLIREMNAKELKRKWKEHLRRQDEKEKAEKENKTAAEKA